jgi:hypothetical protein
MAKLIALRRSAHAVKERGVDDNATAYVNPLHDALREEICHQLQEAQAHGEMTLRPSIVRVFEDPYWQESKHILTTNWDTLLEQQFKNTSVGHIHGIARDWQSLYLPSDYAFDPSHDDATQQRMFRDMDDAIRTLWRARRVCIFGLGLDPLDAELALIVETGLNSAEHLIEVRICNLACQEEKLRKRLALLVNARVAQLVTFQAV